MTGTGWIHGILYIFDHFAFLVGSEKCIENAILIFLAHNVKYKGKKRNSKMGLEPIKKWQMIKTKGNSIILGGCWTYKSCLRILVFSTKVPFFLPEYGHFWQKCPSLCAQKWHFG